MNKPYFAKWIPVEGGIKENTGYAISQYVEGVTEVSKKDYCENGGDEVFPVGLIRGEKIHILGHEEGTYYWRQECKNVKLFLCSRDIQVGDTGYAWFPDNSFREEKSFTQEQLDNISLLPKEDRPYVFKVIGEISPDALGYVKEGDEFDEDEWEYHTSLEDIHHSDDDNICIKGPCGHFH